MDTIKRPKASCFIIPCMKDSVWCAVYVVKTCNIARSRMRPNLPPRPPDVLLITVFVVLVHRCSDHLREEGEGEKGGVKMPGICIEKTTVKSIARERRERGVGCCTGRRR